MESKADRAKRVRNSAAAKIDKPNRGGFRRPTNKVPLIALVDSANDEVHFPVHPAERQPIQEELRPAATQIEYAQDSESEKEERSPTPPPFHNEEELMSEA